MQSSCNYQVVINANKECSDTSYLSLLIIKDCGLWQCGENRFSLIPPPLHQLRFAVRKKTLFVKVLEFKQMISVKVLP
jgi:hypothetical protein